MTAQNTVKKKKFWKTALIVLIALAVALPFILWIFWIVSDIYSDSILPDLTGMELDSAKSKVHYDFEVVIEHEYSDSVASGRVIRTEPAAGKFCWGVERLTIYVSDGPETVKTAAVTADWEQIGSSPDSWNALEAYVTGDYLYILCEATFGTDFSLKGQGQGYAGLPDDPEKQLPLMLLNQDMSAIEQNRRVTAGEAFRFLIKIPASHFETEKPNHIICKIGCLIGDVRSEIKVSFGIFW